MASVINELFQYIIYHSVTYHKATFTVTSQLGHQMNLQKIEVSKIYHNLVYPSDYPLRIIYDATAVECAYNFLPICNTSCLYDFHLSANYNFFFFEKYFFFLLD